MDSLRQSLTAVPAASATSGGDVTVLKSGAFPRRSWTVSCRILNFNWQSGRAECAILRLSTLLNLARHHHRFGAPSCRWFAGLNLDGQVSAQTGRMELA